MIKRYELNEDRLPPKLTVLFSQKIRREIESIEIRNQNNIDGLYKWRDYLNGIRSYISNPAIAFDYTNRYSRFPNGAIYNRDFDYNVGYVIKTNNSTNQLFVYVFMVNLKPNEFGLKVPSNIKENKQYNTNRVNQTIYLKESELKQMIEESVRNVLKEKMCQRLNESISWSLHRILREHISKTANTKW